MNLRLLGIVVGFLCLFTSIAFLLSRPAGDRTYSARRSIVLVPRFFSLESLRAGWYLTWRLGPIIAAFAFTGIIFRFYSLCGGTSWEPLVINLMIFLFFTSIGFLVIASAPLQRLAAAWAYRRYAVPLERSVRWTVIWRGIIVMLGCFDAYALAPLERLDVWFGGLISLVLPIAVLGVVVLGWGWALTVATAPAEDQPPEQWPQLLQAPVRPAVALVAIVTCVMMAALPNLYRGALFQRGC